MEEDLEILEKELVNIRNLIDYYTFESLDYDNKFRMERFKKAIENLIARNKELKEYANWHIEHLNEDIADYIDDDRKANASIIGELKEEREHWRDIKRINNNEKTYIDYKNY